MNVDLPVGKAAALPVTGATPSKAEGGVGKLAYAMPKVIPVVVLVVLLLVTSFLSPEFFGPQNLINVARQASIVGVVAMGMTFVILSGGIDLSVGSVMAVVGVACAMMLQAGHNPLLVLLAGLVIGGGFGAVNGLGVTFLNIQPFVMTLATLVIARGLALRLSNGGPQYSETESSLWDFFGSTNVGPVPGPLIVFLIVFLASFVVLRYLPLGRKIFAVGGNAEAARLSGVRLVPVKMTVYIVSGLTAAIAGVMVTARLKVGAPTAGNLMELEAIAAVVIGGTSLVGGIGGVSGTLAGALLLAVLANLLNLLGVGAFDQQIVKGLIIVCAVVLTALALKRAQQTTR